MAFETKVLDTIHCPRCNGMAELRIDQKDPIRNWVFVYTVCPICKLNRYSHTTTRKAVVLQGRIKKMSKRLENNPKKAKGISARIKKVEKLRRGAERRF